MKKFLAAMLLIIAAQQVWQNYEESETVAAPPQSTTTTTTTSDSSSGTASPDFLRREPRLPVPRFVLHEPSQTSDSPQTQAISSLLQIDNRIVEFTGTHESACSPGYVTDDNAFYCVADDTIYIGQTWINQFPYVIQLEIYAHEDGHSEDHSLLSEEQFAAEQFADRYSGTRIRWLHDRGDLTNSDISTIRSWIASIPNSASHGSGAQRLAAFDAGYYNG